MWGRVGKIAAVLSESILANVCCAGGGGAFSARRRMQRGTMMFGRWHVCDRHGHLRSTGSPRLADQPSERTTRFFRLAPAAWNTIGRWMSKRPTSSKRQLLP